MSDKPSLQDKVALVTGASSGIGRATALALAREGADLVLVARTRDALNQCAQEARDLGCSALVAPADVSDREEVEQAVQAALTRYGRVDVLVACAGAYFRRPVRELTIEDLETSMAVNFYGVAHSALAVLPHMLAQGSGHLIFVSSMDGKKGMPLDAPYVAAKFAVAGLGEVMRQELRDAGVAVTTVFPGRVDTPMIRDLRVPFLSAKIPPEAVARAIVRAIHRRPPEVIIPFQARLLLYVNTFSPRLGDWMTRVFHFEGWEVQPSGQ